MLTKSSGKFRHTFLEINGFISTTKKDLGSCFYKRIQDKEIKEGFRIAVCSHHEDRDISLKEAEKVYLTGEFLRKEMSKDFWQLREKKLGVKI